MISAPLIPALQLFRDYKSGDPDAIDEMAELLADDSECFLCIGDAGDDGDVLVIEDAANKGNAIIARLCSGCMSLPLLSIGYLSLFDMTPGEYEGASYDGLIQCLQGDHIALVPKGDAGEACSLPRVPAWNVATSAPEA